MNGIIQIIKKYWEFFSNVGVNSSLSSTDLRKTRLLNQFCSSVMGLVLFSFCFQIVLHLILSGEVLFNTVLMLVSFLPFIAVPLLNYKEKYFSARVAFIFAPVLNIIFWLFLSTGQNGNLHYAFLLSPIAIVILFKKVKTQIFLIFLIYLCFIAGHLIVRYVPPVMMPYFNPNLPFWVFGVWLGLSFLMLRFFTTELLESEEKLNLKNKELEDFARIASHDLREPLRTISSFSSLIQARHLDDLSEEAKEYFDFITSGAGRMNTLVNDLSNYSMVSKNGKSVKVNLNDTLLQVRNNLQASIVESGTTIESDPLPTIDASSSHMIQLFQNIISNSIKFQPIGDNRKPIIAIEYDIQGEYHALKFTDNGIGIPQEYLQEVFAKFKRHNRSQYEGTGLGLATCKKIVDYYHGKITVESKVDVGTSITLHFMN